MRVERETNASERRRENEQERRDGRGSMCVGGEWIQWVRTCLER